MINIRLSAFLLLVTCLSALSAIGCEATASRTFDFTGPRARDILEAYAHGPDCANVVVTVTLRKADGVALLAHAMPLQWLHDAMDASKPVTDDTVRAILQAYVTDAQLDAGGTTIPRWKKRDRTPGFSDGMELTTPLDRRTYAALRATKPNMLCMADIHDMGVCYAWNAKPASAVVVLRR